MSISDGKSLIDPPRSLEAEEGVLGSILLDPSNTIDKCINSYLCADAFSNSHNKLLFESLKEIYDSQIPMDSITIIDWLKKNNRLDKVGGKEYLLKLQESTITPAHIEFYSDMVNQKYMCRRLINTSGQIIKSVQENKNEDASDLLNKAQEEILNLSPKNSQAIELYKDTLLGQFQNVESTDYTKVVKDVTTGYKNLNEKLGGFNNQDMIVLAARPAMGKTSLALNFVEHAALGSGSHTVDPIPVGFFSLEMSREQLVKRMLFSNAKVSHEWIKSQQKITGTTNSKLTRAVDVLKEAQIYIDDTPGLDILELRARARRMKKQYGIKFVVIDYLQLLNYHSYARDGRQRETMAISGAIKGMAKELNIPVMVVSQLSRATEGRSDNMPKISDLRDSGAIEQDADLVLLLYRKGYYDHDYKDNLAIVDIAKYRHGSTGRIKLSFMDQYTRFEDREDNDDDLEGATIEDQWT